MAKPEKTSELIGPDHPISMVANAFSSQAFELAAKMGISRWDLCCGLANACGQILAGGGHPPEGIVMSRPTTGKPMPREDALERIDSLHEIMVAAFDLTDIKGEA